EPTDGKQMYSKRQGGKQSFQTPSAAAEIIGTNLIQNYKKKNDYETKGFKGLIHSLAAGRIMVDVIKQGGWPKWDLIPPACQISQSIDDDDFGANDFVKGWVRPFTPNHIISRWGEQLVKKYGKEGTFSKCDII